MTYIHSLAGEDSFEESFNIVKLPTNEWQ